MSTRNLRIRLGLFVVLAVTLFATLIVMFGSLPSFFRRVTTYSVRFTDAPGLSPGAPVRRSGVRIGVVRDITLDEERGIVRVILSIDHPYRLRKSEQATLVTGLLGSDTSIDFIPRQQEEKEPVDRTPLEPGSELVGLRTATVNTLLKGASEVVPTTQETLNEIRKSILQVEKLAARIEKSVPIAEDTIREYGELAKRARATIPQLERTNALAQNVIRSVQDSVPAAQQAVEEYRLLGKEAREHLTGARKTLERAADEYAALAKDARSALPELRSTSKDLGDFVRSARAALPTFERTADEFRELAGDARKLVPAVNRAVDDYAGTARQATKILEQFDVFWQKNRDSLEDSVQKVNRIINNVSTLASEDNVRKATTTLNNVATASDRLPKISENLTEVTDVARTTLRSLNRVADQLEPLLKQMNETTLKQFNSVLRTMDTTLTDVQKVTGPLGGRSDRITRNVDESVEKINLILGDVRALLRAVDRADGLVKKVLTDPSVYNNIDQATAMVVKMIPRVDRILKDFEVFADKLARHPESLGIGGVVRPGSGLKNPPTPPINHSQVPGVIVTPSHLPPR